MLAQAREEVQAEAAAEAASEAGTEEAAPAARRMRHSDSRLTPSLEVRAPVPPPQPPDARLRDRAPHLGGPLTRACFSLSPVSHSCLFLILLRFSLVSVSPSRL